MSDSTCHPTVARVMDVDRCHVESWTTDECARRLLARGHRVHQHDGVWWQCVRTDFCWPIDWSSPLRAGPQPSWRHAKVGFQHVVTNAAEGNSYLNPMVLDLAQGYGLEKLGSLRRNRTRKGLRSVTVAPITDGSPMIEDGFAIAVEFHERTQWGQAPDRAVWQARYENYPPDPAIDHLLGAFADGRLVAFMTWRGINRTADLCAINSGAQGFALCANDALLHCWVMMVQHSGLYDRVVYTVRSFKPTLDAFKQSHLFIMRSLPARLRLNPLVRAGLRVWRPDYLERLVGLDSDGTARWLARAKR